MNEALIEIDTHELEDLKAAIDRLGKLPQKCVTSAAGKAGTMLKRAVKQGDIPVETGALQSSIIRIPEKSRFKGKKVYQVVFDRRMNDVFQKPIKNPGEAGGKSKHAYYPASQEYGFLTRSKGNGLSYVPGVRFMAHAAEKTEAPAQELMLKELIKNVDKEWMKQNGI